MAKPKIYLLPGMGADSRLYENLKLETADLKLINWKVPPAEADLKDYAKLMLEEVEDPENAILGGTSMGGIVAREMAEIVQPKTLVLISSPATVQEFSAMTALGKPLKIWKLINQKSVERLGLVFERMMQIRTDDTKRIFNVMLKEANASSLRWSVKHILQWEREEPFESYLQIAGEKDLLFPPTKMKSPIVIDKAGHLAVHENADVVSAAIDRYIRSLR
ncbi:alpha/beta fold hydrolase [Halocola ammonii]